MNWQEIVKAIGLNVEKIKISEHKKDVSLVEKIQANFREVARRFSFPSTDHPGRNNRIGINMSMFLVSSIAMLFSDYDLLIKTFDQIQHIPTFKSHKPVTIMTISVLCFILDKFADKKSKKIIIEKFSAMNWLLNKAIVKELELPIPTLTPA